MGVSVGEGGAGVVVAAVAGRFGGWGFAGGGVGFHGGRLDKSPNGTEGSSKDAVTTLGSMSIKGGAFIGAAYTGGGT
jgi:hypothetical protein